jgi:uncharacterized spore protein YtfJ
MSETQMSGKEILVQLRSLAEHLGATSVYGAPVVTGERTVIPVAKIAFGFGGKLAGYIEIDPAGTRFVPIRHHRKIAAAGAVGLALGFLAGFLQSPRAAR